MGFGVARVGDRTRGPCYGHEGTPTVDGTIISGSTTVYADGMLVATIGGTVLGDCGHTGIIDSCSPSVGADGAGVARIGDTYTGTYTGVIVTCSDSVFAE
jgi:uncharacterized Zn-binding protein involved in type VI secretion